MSKIQIVFNGHLDRAEIIAALAADSSFPVEIINKYQLGADDVFTLELNDLDSTNKEGFYKTMDNANYLIEADALIWKIKRTGKVFNLNTSFVRDAISTDGTLTKIPDGTQLKARFEIPGFDVNEYREIDLWIGEDFNPTDLGLLAEIGITIDGDGGYFEIDNATACRVSFSVPSGATDVYIIDDVDSNVTIEV